MNFNRMAGTLAWYLTRSITGTMRIEERVGDPDYYREFRQPFILALLHGRMVLPMYAMRGLGYYAIVSKHSDGELVTVSLAHAGVTAVRGSTSRGGARALVESMRILKSGGRMAVTVDGPRGPCGIFQQGAVYLAAKTGAPIVLITGSVSRSHTFASWDRFQLPMPFSKGIIISDPPYFIRDGVDADAIEHHRGILEARLREMTLEADTLVGAVSQL